MRWSYPHRKLESMELVELVVRAMQGDREAFSAIVQLTHARLYRTACLILRDPDLAADAVQDAFVSAWVDAKAIRDPARFEAWLNRLLVRSCFRVARRTRRRAAVELPMLPIELPAPDREIALVALRDEMGRAFSHLTPEHRAVLVAHHYLQLSDGDAAAAVGIPVGTYKSRLHRATEALRASIEAAARPPVPPIGSAREPIR